MNLCACLGVAPGHRLLLGPVTPTRGYRVDAPAPPPAAPVRMEMQVLRPAHTRRPKRGAAETRALYERVRVTVEDALKAGRDPFEVRDEIAKDEDIERSYVDYIVSKLGLARRRRTGDQVKELAQRALALLETHPKWTKRRVAAELGVDDCYLHVALSRHGG